MIEKVLIFALIKSTLNLANRYSNKAFWQNNLTKIFIYNLLRKLDKTLSNLKISLGKLKVLTDIYLNNQLQTKL